MKDMKTYWDKALPKPSSWLFMPFMLFMFAW
jgi:hypothetical protein